MREVVTAIGDKSFSEFSREDKSFRVTTATKYSEEFSYPVMFSKDTPKNGLSETVAKAGLSQFHTAETEKYAHVTFFFNGGVEEPFENESRLLVPSPKVKTYDLQPEMSAETVTDGVLKAMESDYDFIVVNYANGDMVGHTGDFEAGVRAVETVDTQLSRVLEKAKERDYSFVLTSDHGNCEEMRDSDGNRLTNHTVGDVWCFVSANGVDEVADGGLNNIAPTVLKLMDLEIPEEMDKPLI
jgi:2,3-bisphosphoglycerate-independent phosphoglycerate mutase